MTVPRHRQISLEHTPYYHCTTRCVRRAFLCGKDRYTGKDFAHRKQWIEYRLCYLSAVFAIDLCAYAVMSNHYHVVVKINPLKVRRWTDEEVVERWSAVFSTPDDPSAKQIEMWRARLSSLSWYMRCLNEPLARRSNREDGCKGRFWEGRYRCQALLDESALVKCMAYVDLNPIRASVSTSMATSNHTSIKARIGHKAGHLAPFSGSGIHQIDTIPIRFEDYLTLVEWTGRELRKLRPGIPFGTLPPILARANIGADSWIKEMQHYGNWYYRAVGSAEALEGYCRHLGQQWLKGSAGLIEIFG